MKTLGFKQKYGPLMVESQESEIPEEANVIAVTIQK
jgi:hypothetical protein